MPPLPALLFLLLLSGAGGTGSRTSTTATCSSAAAAAASSSSSSTSSTSHNARGARDLPPAKATTTALKAVKVGPKPFTFPSVYSTELNGTNFDASLAQHAVHAEHLLVEFYVSWCPHCQGFAVEYERAALAVEQHCGELKKGAGGAIQGPGAAAFEKVYGFAPPTPCPHTVAVLKVDCATAASEKLCDEFGIKEYVCEREREEG